MSALDPRLFSDSAKLLNLKNQAQRLSLAAAFRPSGIFAGQNHSRLRGQGLSFEELRAFRVGDNIKNIDWKASSRANSRVVKVFTQETDRPALVVCDQRTSMFFGSQVYMKSVVAAEVASLMAWLFHHRGDRVGGLVLGPLANMIQAPARTSAKLSQFINEMVKANQALGQDQSPTPEEQAGLRSILANNLHLLGSSGSLILVVDGLTLLESDLALLKRISIKHNVIVLLVNDLLELDYQSATDLVISDGQRQIKLDDDPQDLLKYQNATSEQLALIHKAIHQSGLPFASFNTVDDPYLQLSHLLRGHN